MRPSESRASRLRLPVKPLVSVVTPCFNAADTLPRAVASVRRQTMAAWEMVIADDGSTDGRTLEVARALVDDRVRLVELSRNRGPGVARNAAIHTARADIIMPLDADDELMPDALRAIVSAFDEDPSADFVYGPYIRVSLDGTEREIHAHPTPDPGIIPWHVLSPYRRRFWERAGGYDERPSFSTGAEDWIMWLRGLDRGGRGKAIPVVLMRYYRRAGSLSRPRLDGRSATRDSTGSGADAPGVRSGSFAQRWAATRRSGASGGPCCGALPSPCSRHCGLGTRPYLTGSSGSEPRAMASGVS
jgi:glycosyltransferase involved in cell wall biosynthesis